MKTLYTWKYCTLKEEVENPHPDKRRKGDWASAPTFLPGLYKVQYISYKTDAGEPYAAEPEAIDITKVGARRHTSLSRHGDCFSALLPKLVQDGEELYPIECACNKYYTHDSTILEFLQFAKNYFCFPSKVLVAAIEQFDKYLQEKYGEEEENANT